MPIWNAGYYSSLLKRFKIITEVLKLRIPAIIDGRVAPSPDSIPIGSARKMKVAVLFFDIRGSSDRSGSFEDEALKRALYALDSVIPMVMHIVHDHDGYIEKNTGDGVMAIIPGIDENKAAKAALEIAMTCFYILEKVVNPYLMSLSIPAVDARIGIDFGTLLIARVGTRRGSANQDRSFLTAIGPAANIACRLQEQAGTNEIWVGNAIKARAPEEYQWAFRRVIPADWIWVNSGSSDPYPAWHFYLKRTEPLPSAALLLTSPQPPSPFTLLDLLRRH